MRHDLAHIAAIAILLGFIPPAQSAPKFIFPLELTKDEFDAACPGEPIGKYCKPNDGQWVAAKDFDIIHSQFSNDIYIQGDQIQSNILRDVISKEYMLLYNDAGAADVACALDAERLGYLQANFRNPIQTSLGSVELAVNEKIFKTVEAALTAILKTNNVSTAVSGSVMTKLDLSIRTNLSSASFKKAQYIYYKLGLRGNIRGLDKKANYKSFGECAGLGLITGINGVLIKDFSVALDSEYHKAISVAFDAALQGEAAVNPALKLSLKATFLLRYVKEVQRVLKIGTDFKGKTLFFPFWVKYEQI